MLTQFAAEELEEISLQELLHGMADGDGGLHVLSELGPHGALVRHVDVEV